MSFHATFTMYTLELLQSRRSVRSFDDYPLSVQEIGSIRAEITLINSFMPGTRFQLICENDAPFTGTLGNYGIFRNVRNYIAAVIDTGVDNYAEIAGYCGQQAVIRALSKGVQSCFVGGTYSGKNIPAQLRAGEKTLFIIALGHPFNGKQRWMERTMYKLMHRTTMTWQQFFDESKGGKSLKEALCVYPALEEGLKAVACAPSAVNRRPVRVRMDDDGNIRARVGDTSGFSPVDLGIAKFNFQCLFPGEWDFGNDAPFHPFD